MRKNFNNKRIREEEKDDDFVPENILEGRNPVLEALRAERTIDKLLVATDISNRLGDIVRIAKNQGIVVTECDRRKLDAVSTTGNHQGVIAYVSAKEYVSIEEILNTAKDRNQKPLIVICDGITDPHNLGAIIRSAETAGAHGIIIPKRRASGLTAVVSKASAGAIEHMNICKVTNIATAIEKLKELGVWIFCADGEATSNLYKADLKDSSAIVIGSEGEGVSRIVREKCDFLVSIPMMGNVSSLNASNACAVLLYEAVRQRMEVTNG